jgi:hypothetical protein
VYSQFQPAVKVAERALPSTVENPEYLTLWNFHTQRSRKSGDGMADFRWEPVGVPGATLPYVQDVGAMKANLDPFSQNPNYHAYVYWVGGDGSLWRTLHGVEVLQQVPSPGDLACVAVSPDMSVWCVDRRGKAWVMRGDFNWSPVPVPGETVVDVDVGADKSAWLVMQNTRYYVQRNDASSPRYVGVLLSISAITGIEQPIFVDDSPNMVGKAWGVSDIVGDDGLVFSDGIWEPGVATILGVADLSIAPSNLWMVKADGTVWTTTDGRTQLRRGDLVARRVACNYADNAYAVGPDGRAWVWTQVVSPAPTLPPPPPPPPPQEATRPPVLNVSTTGSGENTVFKLTGSGFLPSTQVTVRGVRLGDGQVFEWYWLTSSNGVGALSFDIPLPCVSGLVIHFSANDGRVNAADHTNRLWSNTVASSCP